jgi:hypothetical protein
MTPDEMIYLIRVSGLVDPRWSEWFDGMQITPNDADPSITSLSGPVRDQAALRGLLNKLWDMNLLLVSLERVNSVKADSAHEIDNPAKRPA